MAKDYIIQGFYPDGTGFRTEVVANTMNDAMILAQGALKVTTLKCTYLIDGRSGDKLALFSNNLVMM